MVLAIPLSAYNGIFSEAIGETVRDTFNLKLVVYDPDAEEIVKMDTLKEVVKKAMAGYAVKGLNSDAYLTVSPDENLLTVVDIAHVGGQRIVATSLIVHIVNKHVIVEHDDNNKPLVDALVQADVPRSKIILAYLGEAVPEVML